MKAVNLVPADARRGRGPTTSGGSKVSLGTPGPAQFLVILLAIVVVLVLLRVLADNTVNNKKATLAVVQSQVATEQAQAAKLHVYIVEVQKLQTRESALKQLAEQRFDWKRSFDQISHVLPASTSLTSLSATTSGSGSATASASASASASSATTPTGPTFSLSGCAATPNQNGVATVLRRLRALTGVKSINFESSAHSGGCNNFTLTFTYAAPAGDSASSSAASTTAGGVTR